jgi:FkbM family methyltransferase
MSLSWKVRTILLRVPGAYEAVQWVSKQGHNAIRPIPFGPLSGMRWEHDASLPLWYRIGLYEPDVARLIQRHLRPGDSFWDVGANAGYHSLVAARSVGTTGCVVLLEPDPYVARIARRQVDLNRMGARVVIVQAAVSDSAGRIEFTITPNNRMSAISSVVQSRGQIDTVVAVTLDQLSERYGTPDLIKMDIEGGETLALLGAQNLLSDPLKRPRILLSTHGREAEEFCREVIAGAGYRIESNPEFAQMLTCLPT